VNGVVSLLPEPYYQRVSELWRELERDFGLSCVSKTPFPHFSYQIARGYQVEALERVLRETAAQQAPFRVRTSGLGVFTGAQPVLYIAVARHPELSEFQRRLWGALAFCAEMPSAYYLPDRWMPHITLSEGDLKPEAAGAVVRRIAGRDFYWEFDADNIAFIRETDGTQRLRARFDFAGSETRA
jgi:2'-5' RNA ligase